MHNLKLRYIGTIKHSDIKLYIGVLYNKDYIVFDYNKNKKSFHICKITVLERATFLYTLYFNSSLYMCDSNILNSIFAFDFRFEDIVIQNKAELRKKYILLYIELYV